MSAVEGEDEAVKAFKEFYRKYMPEKDRITSLQFKPRASDVIIATTDKSGTTMMQHLVHGLRTGGSMDFEDISVVIPHIEFTKSLGIDPEAEQVATPRVYKTHECYDFCPKGAGRYIVVIRHPLDICPSLYSFLNGWYFPSQSISPDTFIRLFMLNLKYRPDNIKDRPPLFYVIESWWKRRNDDNVLFLFYEDIVEKLAEKSRSFYWMRRRRRETSRIGHKADVQRIHAKTRF